jgi:non-ribosomal peptide synthetase component F
LHPERRPSHQPLFSVCISFQNAPISTLDLPGVTLSPLLLENTAAHFDLSLYMMDTTQGLSLSLEYRTDLYYPGTIAKMLEHFSILLNEVAASPEQRLIDLLLLTEEKSSLAEERIALSNQDHAEEFNFQL